VSQPVARRSLWKRRPTRAKAGHARPGQIPFALAELPVREKNAFAPMARHPSMGSVVEMKDRSVAKARIAAVNTWAVSTPRSWGKSYGASGVTGQVAPVVQGASTACVKGGSCVIDLNSLRSVPSHLSDRAVVGHVTSGGADPGAGVAEEAHPGGVVLPFVGVPGVLDGAEDPLGVGHHDGHASVWGGEGGDAAG
jgi:hypothetical protein